MFAGARRNVRATARCDIAGAASPPFVASAPAPTAFVDTWQVGAAQVDVLTQLWGEVLSYEKGRKSCGIRSWVGHDPNSALFYS
jgi:hypothetical protein